MDMDTCRQQGKYKVWTLNELINVSDFICHKISPCSCLLGIACRRYVKIHQLDYKNFCRNELLLYHVEFDVEDIKWSPDSKALLIMCLQESFFVIVQFMSGTESVFRVQDPKTVDLLTVEWAPDSQHVVSVSKHKVYAFAHSMIDGKRILLPTIVPSDKGKPLMAFSPDGKYLATVSFSNLAFNVTLTSTLSWRILWKTKLQLIAVQTVQWSPNSTLLALWDNSMTISFLELNGETTHNIQYNSLRRDLLVTTMFSPNSDLFIAAYHQDEGIKIAVYNLNTWRMSADIDHMKDNHRDGLKKDHIKLEEGIRGATFNVENQLTISHCGGLLASSLVKGQVLIWNLRDGCELIKAFAFPESYAGLIWHPKKTNLCLAVNGGEVVVWKLRQEGPITPKASLESLDLNLGTVKSMSWSSRKLVFCSLKQPLSAVISIRTKT